MDTAAALTQIEGAVADHLALTGSDPSVEQASQALLTALRPAFRQVAYELAQQAAHEVSAQLPGKEVDVVLEDGEPVLRVRNAATDEVLDPEDLDARITLRVPANLKQAVESAAQQLGDSVNSFVVRTLAAHQREAEQQTGSGRAMKGTIRL
jgi:uncharacterized protein (DUF1778 family)